MLLNENLLRNMIRHVLTRKLLKEDNDLNFDIEEVENSPNINNLKKMIENFKSTFLNNFESNNEYINNTPTILEKTLCKIIYETIVISSFFKKNSVNLGENIKERGDSKLIEIINRFINRKGKEINWDPKKISKDKSKYVSSTKEMKQLFLALGLQYHTFVEDSDDSDDDRTGGQIARIYKNKAIKQTLGILQSQKLLSNYIDGLMKDLNTESQNNDLIFNSEEVKELEGNQQQQKNPRNENDLDFKDDNDIGMDSKLPTSADFKNSKKSQWPKTFLKPSAKRTPVESIIRNLEAGQYSTPIEEIFKNIFEKNMSWRTEQNDLVKHLSGYMKFLKDDNNFKKYGKYIGEIETKLIELVDKLANEYRGTPQKDKIVGEMKHLINELFKSIETFHQEKLQKVKVNDGDKKYINNFLNQKRNQFTSSQKNNSLFKF